MARASTNHRLNLEGIQGQWAWRGFLALVAFVPPLLAAQQPSHAPEASRLVQGEFLVKFRGGSRGSAAAQAQQTFKHEVKRHFDRLGWQHIRLPQGAPLAQTLARYRQHADVLMAEPNYVFRLRLIDTNSAVVPNDPRFGEQWALSRIGATNTWALTRGSPEIVVAVLDTGLRYTHEDLAGNMWRNPGEIPGNGIDDDANGYVDDVYGIDAVTPDSDPIDQPIGFTYHGTACGSIIGAVGNNGLGIAGLNWSVKLMALRLAATSNHITAAWLVECFEYVLAMKSRGVNIRVTSNSYGIDDAPSLAVREAIDAVGNAGVLNVFAAGNSNRNLDVTCDFPACFRLPSMLSVAASDAMDSLASFSNYGATNVDLAAPGVNILVADGITTNSYNPNFSGTSASCPHVAGAAALLAAAYPSAVIGQIKSALVLSVDQLPSCTNLVRSHGRLNVARAMQHPLLSTNAPPFILAPPQSQTVGLGYPANFHVTATGAEPMHYDWLFNGANFARTEIPRLALPAVSLQDSGPYAVVLSNALGRATSAVAVLTVVTEPTILSQSQSMRVLDATNLTLSVTAAGAFPLSYQWQFGSQNIAGATNANLALTNVDWRMSGDYRTVLSNTYGIRTSAVVRLTVLTRAYVVEQPQSQTVSVGTDVSLSVTATNAATLPIGFRWTRNGLLAGLMVLNNQFTAVTNFSNVQTNVAGRWSVLLTNEAPNGVSVVLSSNAYLTVVVPPTNQTVLVGSDATFTGLAAGPAPLRYQWQRAGVNLVTATGPSLSLTNVQFTDAGLYSFIVTNAVGQAAVFRASLDVFAPEPLLAQPRRLSDGSFQMVLLGLIQQQPYAVEISSDLTQWISLATFTATNSMMPFRDVTAAEAQRFYRARLGP